MAVVSMSKQEFSRLEVLLGVQSGRLRIADASRLIGICRRHVVRLLCGLRQDGASSLVSTKDIGFDPIAVSLEHRVPLAEAGRQIAPRSAGPDNPQHRLDKPPVVSPAPPGVRRLAQAVRLHRRPLRVGQHESLHPKLQSCSP